MIGDVHVVLHMCTSAISLENVNRKVKNKRRVYNRILWTVPSHVSLNGERVGVQVCVEEGCGVQAGGGG